MSQSPEKTKITLFRLSLEDRQALEMVASEQGLSLSGAIRAALKSTYGVCR